MTFALLKTAKSQSLSSQSFKTHEKHRPQVSPGENDRELHIIGNLYSFFSRQNIVCFLSFSISNFKKAYFYVLLFVKALTFI